MEANSELRKETEFLDSVERRLTAYIEDGMVKEASCLNLGPFCSTAQTIKFISVFGKCLNICHLKEPWVQDQHSWIVTRVSLRLDLVNSTFYARNPQVNTDQRRLFRHSDTLFVKRSKPDQ